MAGFKDYKGTKFTHYILPIIPAGAKLAAEGTSLDQDKIGKIPGQRTKNGWIGFQGWTKNTATDRMLDAFARFYEPPLVETVGCQAVEFIGTDVDVTDEEALQVIELWATWILGDAPTRTRPNSGKFLRMYRRKPGAVFITKRRLSFRTKDGREHAIEILGRGQQYLLEGRHPSGVNYEWRDGKTPIVWGADNLIEVDNDKVNLFLKTVKTALEGIGCDFARPGAPPGSGQTTGSRYPIGPDHPDQALSRELLADLLKACPCDAKQFADRDEWIKALAAIKAACAGDETFYDDHVWPWCEAYADNTEEYVRNVWESFHDSALGWSYLVDLAQDFGWSGLVRAMFDPIELDDEESSSDYETTPPHQRNGPIPKLMPADFVLHRLPRREFVLGRRFMAGTVTLCVGAPGTAKSTLANLTALSIATGQPLTGEPVHRRGRVWIHNNEDSLDELYRRIGGTLKYHGNDFASARENIFVTSGLDERLVIAIKEKDIVKRTAAVAALIASIKQEKIIHIVIDPFVSTHRGVTENSNEEIEQVAEIFRYIAHQTGCSIDLIHHSLKVHHRNSEAQAGDMNAARGASSLIGAVRMLYTVSPMSEATATKLGLSPDEAVRFIRVDHAKGNYSARDGSIKWFELESYDIGNGTGVTDEDFSNGDTIAVPKPWTPSTASEPPKPVEDREAQRQEKLQRVCDFVARTMSSERSKLMEILPAIKREFVVENSAARKLLKEAIPEGVGALAQVHGCTYSMTIERNGPAAPHPLVIVRKLIGVEAQAA